MLARYFYATLLQSLQYLQIALDAGTSSASSCRQRIIVLSAFRVSLSLGAQASHAWDLWIASLLTFPAIWILSRELEGSGNDGANTTAISETGEFDCRLSSLTLALAGHEKTGLQCHEEPLQAVFIAIHHFSEQPDNNGHIFMLPANKSESKTT